MKRQVQKGFTLIELMIVVAIIGILAAIAIPQYQDYLTRARWSDTIQSVGQLKAAIGECVQNNNGDIAAAACQSIAALRDTGEFLPKDYPDTIPATKLGVVPALGGNGVITLDGSAVAQLAKCIVKLTPTVSANQLTWNFETSGDAKCNRAKTGVGGS